MAKRYLIICTLVIAICSCRKETPSPAYGKIRFTNNSQRVCACSIDDSEVCTLPINSYKEFTVKTGTHDWGTEQISGDYPRIATDGYSEVTTNQTFNIPIN